MGAVNVRGEDYSQLYEELPGDLIEDILAWLPAEYLYRFTTVCKQWNALFSSTSFVRRQWAEAPPNINPWLVLGGVENSQNGWTYSCFTRSWRNSCLSLDFLVGKARPPFTYLGSGAGLFLMQGVFSNSIYVCNPLTAKYLVLPPIAGTVEEREIGIVEEGEDGYKVFVVQFSATRGQHIVGIYDSTDKAWTMAGLLPRHLDIFEDTNDINPGPVFSGGYLYCLMVAPEGLRTTDGIMGFNIVEGTSTFVPLPRSHHNVAIHFIQLLHCGSRILLVQAVENEAQPGEEVVTIWEFNKDAATKWKEIATKPPTVPRLFNTIGQTQFRCAAIGDCLYFKRHREMQVVVYNLTQNSWTFLPTFPPTSARRVLPLIAFKPRPDMKLE